ncbi:GNAT family N-acetyltransferase [Aliishimia ponticola]|uniref:GNAT family N-acetyltransferase n=1 Tax=Aliishimia ponticola TaxID=2499833 RepID=A0A4S4NH65_9RHOB|nr:GNAT family N-acetyltransferase [Aliishimia ponticola]THH38007.1 GNAT family N-acetyltransferase [Aliishimia ponticola]
MTLCRNASFAELEQILDWADDEGWNPGLDDAAAFFATVSKGFFVAVDEADQPVASISVVNHTVDFAFLGFYIVRPDYRGLGIGLALWNHALQHAGTRTVGLDGVEDQQDNYRASGFVHAGAATRFTGHSSGQAQSDVFRATPEDIPQLIAMEAAASGLAKPTYLKAWLSGTATRKTFVLRSRDEVQGFATVRACHSGAKIGPLVAQDAGSAEKLMSHAAHHSTGPLTVDVPETSQELLQLCHEFGMEPGFRTARMYRGNALFPTPSVYAVASLELG